MKNDIAFRNSIIHSFIEFHQERKLLPDAKRKRDHSSCLFRNHIMVKLIKTEEGEKTNFTLPHTLMGPEKNLTNID